MTNELKSVDVMPGNIGLPLIGNTISALRKQELFYWQQHQKYGNEEDKKQPYSLIGFGGGVYSCLGVELAQMEMKIILSTLLQKYDWTVTPTTAEIAPVRRPFAMQKQLKAKFIPI